MLRYKTYFLLLFLSCICSGMVADNTDDEDLLRKLDGMIEQREVYQRKVEKEIADLRRTLTYAEDDKLQFDILGNLFPNTALSVLTPPWSWRRRGSAWQKN